MFVASIGDVRSFFSLHGRPLGAVALLVLALVVGARLVLGAGAARHEAPQASLVRVAAPARAAAPRRILVHVVGAVRRPGLYRLVEGARVADAVGRAGGPTRRADTSLVNLAAPVADGMQVVVPGRGAPAAAGAGATGSPGGPVSLSAATIEQLDALPGVGPVTAQKIVAYREKHGPFRSVQALDAIPGIGPARIEQLRDLVVP
jgi:competence protein ComEA